MTARSFVSRDVVENSLLVEGRLQCFSFILGQRRIESTGVGGDDIANEHKSGLHMVLGCGSDDGVAC